MKQVDIVIAGAGPAGLCAAAAFAAQGAHVAVVDPTPPITDTAATGADLRSTAILAPGRALLEQAGVWDHLDAQARPLQAMRIVDASDPNRAPISRDFDAQDLDQEAFGWNLPNTALRAGVMQRLSELNVDLMLGLRATGMIARDTQAIVRLSDGTQIAARLVLACDGRNSTLRQAAGIGMRQHGFGQKAIVFAATHDAPHDYVSTEIHKSGGPFTLVPLPDHAGTPCSAIVWMADSRDIARLSALPDAAFEAEATARSAALFGTLRLASPRQVWPIVSQIAERLIADRLAIAAEAAHVVPPIGAQGLNMSLADIAALVELTADAPDPGAPGLLARYHKARMGDIRLRIAGVSLLNHASQTGIAPLQRARSLGVRALHDIAPLRRAVMRMGLGGGLGRGLKSDR